MSPCCARRNKQYAAHGVRCVSAGGLKCGEAECQLWRWRKQRGLAKESSNRGIPGGKGPQESSGPALKLKT